MAKIKHRYYGKFYSSGNKTVDWIFRRFIDIYNNKISQIVLKRRLKDDNGDPLDGQWDPETGILELNPDKTTKGYESRDILQSFIHELAHILHGTTKEKHIIQIEKTLWKDMSESQKRALRNFIPKDMD